jgi:triosephosphate isomerase
MEEVLQRQLHALAGVNLSPRLTVAYEPVWAIGTGVPATPEAAREIMGGAVLHSLAELYGESRAREVPLLYGGSVTAANAESFAAVGSIHGALVGGASLRADEFIAIALAFARVKGVA